jgi:hypothetical protein
MYYISTLKQIFVFVNSLLFFLYLANCNHTNKKDYQDDFNDSLLLTVLVTPEPNPVGKCTAMMTKASECTPNASDKTSLLNTLETTFNLTYGSSYGTIFKAILNSDNEKYTTFVYSQSPSTLSFSTYCNSAVSSEALKKASSAFKDCFYTCQADNWSYYVTNSLCSTGKTADLVTGSLGVGQNLCAIKCSKTTNN